MSKRSQERQKKRNKSQRRAVILLVVISIAAISIAFFISRGSDSVFSKDSFEQKSTFGPKSGDYDNLQGEISRFFLGVKRTMWPEGNKKKSIINIDLGERSLLDILDEKIRIEGDPVTLSWRGPIKSRWFMADETLKSNAERLAAEENMELIWWLDKDYVVRAAFQVNSDVLNTLDRLARSLNSHHPGNVQAYLCPRQRVILIAGNGSADSVRHYCTSVDEIRIQAKQAK